MSSFIVLDDTGFGQLGCFGSPIETPNLDALASNGLRYNNMHTTALCSPSRSCIVTGRNHHSNAMACVTEFATGFPGYDGNVPFENGFLSEMLVAQGYNTYMVGKWHLIPASQESGAGPYDRWPLGRGFERFYGFLGGDTSQWNPDLVYDNHQVEPPATPEEGYHLTPDLVDKAIGFIADANQVDPDKPFYLHFCPGATHAPHHVPKEWADKYAGKFNDGWDAYRTKTFARQKELGIVPADCELSRHDPDVPDWDSLSDDQRRLYAREMEVFAGFLSHTDHHIGRLIEFLRTIGQLDNTLIMVVSDNGASAEGGVTGTTNEAEFFNNCPAPVRGRPEGHRRARRPQALQPLPVGLDLRREHAVPPVEARDLPRRIERSVHRALAGGDQGPRRDPHAVRAHHRHGADRARPARHRPTRDDQGRPAVTDPGRELRAHARRRDGAEQPSHAVLRDDRPPLDLPRRLARGVPVARPVVRGSEAALRRTHLGRHPQRARRRRLGAVPRRRGLRRDEERGGRQP